MQRASFQTFYSCTHPFTPAFGIKYPLEGLQVNGLMTNSNKVFGNWEKRAVLSHSHSEASPAVHLYLQSTKSQRGWLQHQGNCPIQHPCPWPASDDRWENNSVEPQTEWIFPEGVIWGQKLYGSCMLPGYRPPNWQVSSSALICMQLSLKPA